MAKGLDAVKEWMTFFGWTAGGGPGGVKCAYGGTVVAQHGDATWIADVELSIEKAKREAIVAEIERRERGRA